MKKASFAIVLLIFGTLSASARASAPVALSVDDLPKLVGSKNKHVSAAKSLLQGSERRTGYLLRSYLPNVKVEAGGESFQTGPFSIRSQPYGDLEGRINLFRGGRDALEEDVRQGQVKVADSEARQTYFSELTEARKAFWHLLYQREVLKLLKAALEQNEKNLAAALKRIRGGLATATDRIEFEINRVQLGQDIARLELEITNAQRKLSALLSMPLDTAFETADTVPHEHDDAILRASLNIETHRDVTALKANQTVLESQKSQAYRWWTPSLDAYGNYSLYTLRDRDYVSMTDRYETVVGLKLTLELFDGLQSRSEGAAASAQADAYADRAAQTSQELAAQFENSRQELKLIHDLIHEGEKNVEQGREYLANTQSEYGRGVKNSPDVLSATQKYIEFRRRYAELRRDYQMAKADLLAVLGE